MIRKFAFVSCLALSGCAVPVVMPLPAPTPIPQPPEPIAAPLSAKERFVSSVVANGCALNSDNTDLIMADAVLSREDLARVMTELRAEGRGQIDGASFRVISGTCV
jgi:hypothetical protein